MPIVTDTVKDPQGRALTRAVVTIRLFASTNGGAPGYVGATDYSIQHVAELRTDTAGLWSVTLAANATISPANSYYEYEVTWRGRVIGRGTFQVPDTAGPFWVGDILYEPATIAAAGAAPSGGTFLVTTASASLPSAVAVGATPGGELGGTWPSPTVDASHGGGTHAAAQAAAEATAAVALAAHSADTTDQHGIADTADLARKSAANTFSALNTVTGQVQLTRDISTPTYAGEFAGFKFAQTRSGARADDAMVVFEDTLYAVGDGLRAQSYFTDRGSLRTGREVIISQKRDSPVFAIRGILPGFESGALDISPDGNFPALRIEAGITRLGTNSYALAVYDADVEDPRDTGTGYYWGSGTKKFVIGQAGRMLWGASLGEVPLSNADLSVERAAARVFQVEGLGTAGELFLRLKAHTAQPATIDFYRAATLAAQLTATLDYALQIKAGGTTIMDYYGNNSVPKVSLGCSVATSLMTLQPGSGFPGLSIRRTGGATPADMIRILSSDGATIYYRVNKDGYPINAKVAAPADADLSASEMAIWFDATNGAAKLKIKGKSANGTVVAGEVALA